jgi:hypothetical protein
MESGEGQVDLTPVGYDMSRVGVGSGVTPTRPALVWVSQGPLCSPYLLTIGVAALALGPHSRIIYRQLGSPTLGQWKVEKPL